MNTISNKLNNRVIFFKFDSNFDVILKPHIIKDLIFESTKLIKKLKHISVNRVLTVVLVTFTFIFSLTTSAQVSKKRGIKTVVIDAGHGGPDAGCSGSSVKEKDVALAIALKLGNYIEKNYTDVKVIYTRKTDVFVEVHERANIIVTLLVRIRPLLERKRLLWVLMKQKKI
jgi:N-acetylmuramoyl-L-alanine amidase